MPFSEILGQPVASQMLRQSLQTGRISHACLFHGPEGAGKKLTARIFAQALNCDALKDDACGVCVPCKKINPENNRHPDVQWVVPPQDKQHVSIKQVRALMEENMFRPFEGKKRVYIFPEVHLLETEAANAFLKLLEEPPSYTVFILVSSVVDSLLPTLRSRCQPVPFVCLSHEHTVKILAGKFPALSRQEHLSLAGMYSGQPGKALKVNAEEALNKKTTLFEQLGRLSRLQPLSAMQAVQTHTQSEESPRKEALEALEWTALFFREMLFRKKHLQPFFLFSGENMSFDLSAVTDTAQAGKFSSEEILSFLKELLLMRAAIRQNASIPLALSSLFTNLIAPANEPIA